MSIAEQLSILNSDEALEITPKSCRLRKAILDPHERKKSEKSGAAGDMSPGGMGGMGM
jgi:GTP-binding protein